MYQPICAVFKDEPSNLTELPTNQEGTLRCQTYGMARLSWMIQFPGETPVDSRADGGLEILRKRNFDYDPGQTGSEIVLRVNYSDHRLLGNNGTLITCIASIIGLPVSEAVVGQSTQLSFYGTQFRFSSPCK